MMLAVTEKGAAGVYAKISEKVWISRVISVLFRSRTPHGVRGLKYPAGDMADRDYGRTPHGVRELKSPTLRGKIL